MSIFRKNKLLSVGPSVIEEGLEGKQAKLSNAPAYSTPADSDALCDVVLSDNKVKRITFANLWTWVLTKITAVCEKGIQVSSGKIGHSNAITIPTAKRILQATYDAQGHVTAIENEFNWSNTYNTSADNQLFTRKGANALYKELNDVAEETITFNSSYIEANYSKVFKVGKVYMCNIAFQAKSSNVPANTWLIRLSGNVVKSSTEVYCVLHCTDLTNVPTTRLLQLGGSASFNQFFVKTNPLPGSKYYFGSCIIINNV